MPVATIPSASILGTNTSTRPGRWTQEAPERLGPEEAVRFARGEEVVSTSGQPVKLGKPLDWIAVTDHSDGMGVITEIKAGNAEMMQDATIKRWHDLFAKGGQDAKSAVMELVAAQSSKKLPPLIMDPKFAKAVWDKKHRDSGKVHRARPIHGVHRLRVDVQRRRRRQPASQRDLSGR